MNIEKIAVIGAGVMGSAIAAHIANAGIAVDLLDVIPKEDGNRNAIAEGAIAKLLKIEPSPLMHPKNAHLINSGNIEDDLGRLAQADWVIEAVLENASIKHALYQKLQAVCRANTLISSNTSTLPLSVLLLDQAIGFKRRFMITHFFNPPRYMRLLELVAPPELDKDLLDGVIRFADIRLGKGCVLCNDTPGFIANRIGTFWIQTAVREAISRQLGVEKCDAAMSLFGVPKTGVFGLLDLVGLDLMPHVLDSFRQNLPPGDRLSIIATPPPILQSMLAHGLTGRKGQGGFYRLQPGAALKTKQAIDLQTGEYRDSESCKLDNVGHRPEALRAFLDGDEVLQGYAWRVWSDTLCYAAELIPEIADGVNAVDCAMRLGYNWRYGPFELIDRLGCDWFAERLTREGRAIPELLADRRCLYRSAGETVQFKDKSGHYQPVRRPEGVLVLNDVKRRAPPLLNNAAASAWDIGDGIVCLEFHSKLNTLDTDSLKLIRLCIGAVEQNFKGLVIYNDADNFSAGANLTLLVAAIIRQDWGTVEDIVRLGQQTYQALKYACFPVVAAPTGLALGGGCEILLHCDAIQAHAELYAGLVETGVGLTPGWGGCKELLRRWLAFSKRPGGPIPAIAQTFETIGLAKISQSAQQARELMFLGQNDAITMNKDRLLTDAKALALALSVNYRPPAPSVYHLPGASARATLDMAVSNLRLAGKATDFDLEISRRLANVLSGGDTDVNRPLTEQDILDLELQSFLYLVKQSDALARLEHMLKTGKPLRN
ncbi:MAG: 3-hydroxyacyl-CoA dehydrogenase NAD-binding domain-containing protein [Methylomonas sp.]|jgi:3-hydroxyacyl-CoA dehydrogenase